MPYSRRQFLQTSALSMAAVGMPNISRSQSNEKLPNIVVVFLDDAGWADFEPFGDPDYITPHVRQLASEGCRFDQFYVPQAICSASRASLLTGCYPGRTKMFGAHAPRARGLDPKYATLGQILQKRGYTTACFGKWHIGDQPDTRPPERGFDESCGLMYSNDMWKHHPENPEYWGKHPLQYWENGEIVINDVTKADQTKLTTWYTEHAVDFIERNKDNPFFLYVPHSMPHVPLFCSKKFEGKSGSGLYGDVMMEIDWSVGQIMKTLKENGIEENTIVMFTSDNGPWVSYGNHAGETPFREAKGTTFDGGTRSALIIKYPEQIEAGTSSDQAFCTIDLVPTIAQLVGAELPDNPIDGKDVWNIITKQTDAKNPHDYYAFSNGNDFQAVLSGDGRWKLHVPHSYRHLKKAAHDGMAGEYVQKQIGYALFDMKNDPYETTNVIDQEPEITAKLRKYAENHERMFYSKNSSVDG